MSKRTTTALFMVLAGPCPSAWGSSVSALISFGFVWGVVPVFLTMLVPWILFGLVWRKFSEPLYWKLVGVIFLLSIVVAWLAMVLLG